MDLWMSTRSSWVAGGGNPATLVAIADRELVVEAVLACS